MHTPGAIVRLLGYLVYLHMGKLAQKRTHIFGFVTGQIFLVKI